MLSPKGPQQGKTFMQERPSLEQEEWIFKMILENIPLSKIAKILELEEDLVERCFQQKLNLYAEQHRPAWSQCPTGVVVDRWEMDHFMQLPLFRPSHQYLWIAFSLSQQRVVAFYVGRNGERSMQKLWKKLEEFYASSTKEGAALQKETFFAHDISLFCHWPRPVSPLKQ